MTRYYGIDPSSSTGIVILDDFGSVIHEEEIKIKHRIDPLRMIEICKIIKSHLNPTTDRVAIEGFSYGSKGRGVSFQYGLGWVIRAMLFIEGIDYIEVTPSQVKKFACNKGNAKKTDLIKPVEEKWGYTHKSDNVIDAYILARIVYSMDNQETLKLYEKKVINDLINK